MRTLQTKHRQLAGVCCNLITNIQPQTSAIKSPVIGRKPASTLPRMVLHTTEITLRRFEPTDAQDFLKWAGDDKVTKYCRWNTFTTEEEAMEFLVGVVGPHPWYRAICVGSRAIGSIFVLPGSGKDERKGEIGYALNAEYWGMGIATAAVKMAAKRVFKELECLDRIEGLVFEENQASQKVLEKAGFLREGLLRKFFYVKGESKDIVVYSVVRDEY